MARVPGSVCGSRAGLALLLLPLLLCACGNDNDPGPGGVTVGEARALDEAAAMIEAGRPQAKAQPAQTETAPDRSDAASTMR